MPMTNNGSTPYAEECRHLPEKEYGGPQKLDRQLAILTYSREGFAIGVSKRKYGGSFKARVALEAIREK